MGLTVSTFKGSLSFDGPHTNTDAIKNTSGVYVITTLTADGAHKVLDVGESHALKHRLNTHDRRDQWQRHKQVGLFASVLYCNEPQRMTAEKHIRASYMPPCGIR